MQKLWLSAKFGDEYGNAQVEIILSLLVYRYAFADQHQEKFLGKGVTDVDLKDFFSKHDAQVIPKGKVDEIFTWVHIAISNSNIQILNTFHNAKP